MFGSFRIGKISDELGQIPNALIAWSSPLNRYTTLQRMYIDTDDEIQALADIGLLRSKYPELQATALSEELVQSEEMFFQRWAIFIVVLIVLIVSTMVGVLNALMNNILSKRKEFAVLRAMGVPPNGIVHIILTQVILYICVGVIVGCMIGVILIVLVLLLDPTVITFNLPIVGLTGISMLLLSILTFIVVGRNLTKKSVPQEITMDGQ